MKAILLVILVSFSFIEACGPCSCTNKDENCYMLGELPVPGHPSAAIRIYGEEEWEYAESFSYEIVWNSCTSETPVRFFMSLHGEASIHDFKLISSPDQNTIAIVSKWDPHKILIVYNFKYKINLDPSWERYDYAEKAQAKMLKELKKTNPNLHF